MISKHCEIRSQQRCIPLFILELLIIYGDERFDGYGGIIRSFSKRSIKNLNKEYGKAFINHNKRWLNTYLVESTSTGTVMTAGRRTKRIKNR